jgi:hypothetical protein
MTSAKSILVLGLLLVGWAMAEEAKVRPLIARDLTEFPGKEGLMIAVEYPPGSSDPVHRHHAHGFIYVLEDPL